ncbi:copper chaperone [Rhodococcus sp. NPDC078407]|uniref:copper chaperone n=1 Tax=Rhodococcus sp. NPDC078407 TaxID=3364509 RepID=UPI0028D8BD49|nr:copper chaperone [uncultured Rhodococcus sp.]
MSTTDYRVTGTTRRHCTASVRDEVDAVAGVAGVDTVDVSASAGALTVTRAAHLDQAGSSPPNRNPQTRALGNPSNSVKRRITR